VLLGASKWPYSPDFPPSQAFTNAARRLKEYFLDPKAFGLPSGNLLDFFDSDQSADDLDREIGQFLDQRISRMKAGGLAARDLVVYFVGHGGFAGGDAEYYLAIRRTRAANPTASGIRIVSLAYTLKEKARYLRHIVILDCCFAAAAFSAFQSSPAQAAITQTLEAFRVPGKGDGIPGRGTSLLCSSRHNRPSLLLPDGSSTMFSQALLEALTTGNPYQQGPLSLHNVASLAEDVLRAMAVGDAPRPEVHSPDQSEGDIADIPFFPNPRATELGTRPGQESLSPLDVASSLRPSAALPTRRRGLPWIKMILLIALALFIVGIVSVLFTTVNTYYSHVSATATVTAAGNAYATAVAAHGIMFGFDTQHMHDNPYEKVLNPTNIAGLVLDWTRPTGASVNSSPAVAGGAVYVGSEDSKLYAFSAQTGELLWIGITGGAIDSSPTVANGVVYVGSDDHKLYAFNVQTGATLWTATTGDKVFSSPAIATNGVVYVGSGDGKLYAFNVQTGAVLWASTTGDSIVSSPAVANGMVYIGSRDSKLYAFDAATGTTLWMASTGQGIDASPAVANGIVYNGSRDGNMYVFNATTGATLWTAPTSFSSGGIETSPTVANGVVYVGSDDGKLYAFNAMKGALLWSFPVGTFYSCPTVANGVVYIGSLVEHKLYAFHLPGTAS
jgi:outer membrane protein assembly factor BamB